ncbi:MAG: ATP phosphoribosyltransferase regulatory subunit [Alphaproteobacteria bacterium]
MTDPATHALLPEGLHDTLAPAAEFEFRTVVTLLSCFAQYGYDQVAPPLVEFEESLLAGVGAAEGRRMFRLMDPVSSRMMGVRTDMTTQVARIAATRLAGAPRPTRLCYAGQVLRVKSSQLRSEREFGQAGVELIGSDSLNAKAEVIALAGEALKSVGANQFSVDLTVPTLVPMIVEALGLAAAEAEAARIALDEKDMAALAAIDGQAGEVLEQLLSAAGPAEKALGILKGMTLPPPAAELVQRLQDLVGKLQVLAPDLTLTIDPGEFRRFEYHSGICFTIFASGVPGEIGRGGRYDVQVEGGTEPAVGATLYVDALLRTLPRPAGSKSVYLPAGTAPDAAKALRESGLRTIQGLEPVDDEAEEAKRLGCSHVFQNGRAEEL